MVDGPIVTALPNAGIGFATSVCERLGLYSAERARRIERHLRGGYVPELFGGSA
ncbi:MAG: hypothetical protein AAGD35_02400 [Actinomycetota bacterium]